MISKGTQEKIIENNKRISELLKENETLLTSEGLNAPIQNYVLDESYKIQIPSGYIRINEVFQDKYHLKEIVISQAVRKNIAYALQLSDLYNYLINRFYIWGSVKTMLYKSAIINFVSVFEAIILECANNICCKADSCSISKSCQRHFNKNQRNNSFDALKRINEINITNFTEEELSRIHDIIGFRNKVHIRLSKENEFISSDFSISLCNEVIVLLQRLSERIYSYGVSEYNKCNNNQNKS